MKFFFISTNRQWSGSEELWTRAALQFESAGYAIGFAARFEHNALNRLKGKRVEHYTQPGTWWSRALSKLLLSEMKIHTAKLLSQLATNKPDAVVISQGNNVDGWEIMNCCRQAGIPYFTITQLVADVHLLSVKHQNFALLRTGYEKARNNFFVSRHNLDLNNRMLGLSLSNAEVIFNPCKTKSHASTIPYPPETGQHQIAMVGRLECFHKGYDLFLEVIANPKWKERPVHFNLYGKGPHEDLIKTRIAVMGITNVTLHSHVEDITEIWRKNHLLLMTSRMEGMPLTLIEAMYCGRAAVVTNQGGEPELIDEDRTGFIGDPTISSIDLAMERAWTQRHRWKEMGEAALKTISARYPEDEIKYFTDRILSTYQSA